MKSFSGSTLVNGYVMNTKTNQTSTSALALRDRPGSYDFHLSSWSMGPRGREYRAEVSGRVDAVSRADALAKALPAIYAKMADWPFILRENAEIDVERLDYLGPTL
jgi:hypothetical protein